MTRARQYCAMLSVVYSSIVYTRRCLPLRTSDCQAGMPSLGKRNVIVVHYRHWHMLRKCYGILLRYQSSRTSLYTTFCMFFPCESRGRSTLTCCKDITRTRRRRTVVRARMMVCEGQFRRDMVEGAQAVSYSGELE